MTEPIRVLLVDDQVMVRDGLAVLLQATGSVTVVGQASDGQEALDLVEAGGIDVVVMDIRMPGMDGLTATARLMARHGEAGPRVLILSTFDLDEYVYDALAAGASGFLLKDAPAASLIEAVEVVARGDALLAPQITKRVIRDVAERRRRAVPMRPEAAGQLTGRELDVLRAMARGLSNAEIAAELYLAEQTVKTHVGRILLKLDLRDRTQAVIFAYENGLVGSSGPS